MADPYVAAFGQGLELRIYDGVSAYDAIPWLGAITGPDSTFDTIDVTTHSSEGGWREFIAGLADGGEVTCPINWHADDPQHQALQDAQNARELTAFQLYFPMYDEDNLIDFNGFVTGLTRGGPFDAQITRDLTIKVTGQPLVSTE